MDKIKHFLDACAAIAACSGVATMLGWLPTILGALASFMAIAWYCLRFYEWFKTKKDIGE